MSISRLHLPKLDKPPATILDHLIARFPHVPPGAWRARVAAGRVTLSDGAPLQEDTPYRHGLTVFYRREVPNEPDAPETETILYRDEDIVAVDKPHGMPVTPAGDYVDRCLLVRLQRTIGVETIAPIHRLDRETAGIVLFSLRKETRSAYHGLFARGVIEREYIAAAPLTNTPPQSHWRIETRIVRGTPWHRQQIVDGPVNAITEIEWLESRNDLALFRLRPRTGKKHQLRLHMASLGFPILGDSLYPEIREKGAGEPPLQLLARRLSFSDPLSAAERTFTSTRSL